MDEDTQQGPWQQGHSAVSVASLLRADAAAAEITDWRALANSIIGLAPFWLIALHRVAHALRARRVPIVPSLLRGLGHSVWGADLWPDAQIGPGLRIAHPSGVVVGSGVRAGTDLFLFSGAVLGGSSKGRAEWQSNQPRLGDRVMVSTHAVVAGGIAIGDDVVIGANTVVLDDVPAGCVVRSPAPQIIPRGRRRSGSEG